MEELFAGRGVDVDAMYQRMKGLMEAEGLEYGKRTHTYNSRMAQEVGKWADTQPGGYAIHDAMYIAYFVAAKNIGDRQVLLDIVESVGLSTEAAAEVIDTRSFEAAVDADWNKSRSYGITGVPTFVAAGMGLVGAQPYEAMEHLMQEAGAARRS